MGADYIILNYIQNKNFKSSEDLTLLAQNSIKELRTRENLMDDYSLINPNISAIKCSDFISKKYKDCLLFYSMNHPTSNLIQFVAENIKNILQTGDVSYTYDELFNSERCILYSCIGNCVTFDVTQHVPNLSKYNLCDIQSIVNKYIDCYSTR